MDKKQLVNSSEDIVRLRKSIIDAATRTKEMLRCLLDLDPILLLRSLKYEKSGSDPLEDRPLNFIEQLNQTFTYLASLDAVEKLIEHHPDKAPYKVNLGTVSGYDIESSDGSVIAEVFAAVRPSNNNKLIIDTIRACESGAEYKYVFYACLSDGPGDRSNPKYPDVRIISLGT